MSFIHAAGVFADGSEDSSSSMSSPPEAEPRPLGKPRRRDRPHPRPGEGRGRAPAPDHAGDLPSGDYLFELEAISTVDDQVEIVGGRARSEYRTRDSLPIGHAMIKGVDLFDGHLVVSRQDFAYPGRGVPLSFERTYSSSGTSEPGPLGAGWSHNYQSKLIVTPCGEVILIGGEGSGMRFVDDGEGGLRPLKGHHGTLLPAAGNAFDFYTKSGNNYHYVFAGDNEWALQYIQDPNGNRTELFYAGERGDLRLTQVRDSSGRSLGFEYERRTFAFWTTDVLTRVSAPGGVEMRFEYDTFGNLTRASREALASERYVYLSSLPEAPLEERHLLYQASDEISGATTTYTYEHGVIGVQGGVTVPGDFVRTVTLPEGGVTTFDYDLAALAGRDTQLVTTVTDGRTFPTVYTLNPYGSTTSILDAEGNDTRMEWAEDDVVMTARLDGNGVRTDLTYDEHGNLLTETLEVHHVDGTSNNYVKATTYHPPSAFDPPYVKNRAATMTDRNGNVTEYTYDNRGNLLKESTSVTSIEDAQPVELATVHTYVSNGDRLSTIDPRKNSTYFSYDSLGNVERVTDALSRVSKTVWNVRSQPVKLIDRLERETLLEYDTLGRLIRRILPAVDGEAVEEIVYDDAARTKTAIDAEDRQTVTYFDLEGRVVKIENAASGTSAFVYDKEGSKTLESTWFYDQTARFDTTFDYDKAGRLVAKTEPLGRVTTYLPDGVGNVIEERLVDTNDPGFEPRIVETAYDELNRPAECAETSAKAQTRCGRRCRPSMTARATRSWRSIRSAA